MYTGVVNDVSTEGQRTLRFDQQYMPVSKSPDTISLQQKKPEEMTIKELKTTDTDAADGRRSKNTLEVELHQRLAIPMGTL